MGRPRKIENSGPVSPFGASEDPIIPREISAPRKRVTEEFSQDLINSQRKRVERDETDAEVSKRLKDMKKQYEEMRKIFGN